MIVGGAARNQLRKGINPTDEQHLKTDSCTVKDLAKEWMERYVKAERKNSAEVDRILKKDVLPHIGNQPASSIELRDAVTLLDKIADRGAPATANRVRSLCLQMYKN